MTVREFRQKFNRVTTHGWLTWEEALLLVDAAERTRGPLIEFGSYMGRSASLLCQLSDDENGLIRRRLYCVDPWDDHFHSDLNGEEIFRRFLLNLGEIRGADVVPVRTKVEWFEPIPAEFLYLDGDHSRPGTKAQIEKALSCKPKVIAVHDVSDSGGGVEVKEAALELLGPWKEKAGTLAVWELP